MASLSAGWKLFLSEIRPLIPLAKWRRIFLWCAAAAAIVVALGLLIPYDTIPERVGYISMFVLIVVGFTAGLSVLAETRESRRGFSAREGSMSSSQDAIDRARKSGGPYDDLPRELQDRLIAQAEIERRTMPAGILSGMLIWVPFGLASVIALALLPPPQSLFPTIMAVLNLPAQIVGIKHLAGTIPIIEYRDSRPSL